MLRQSLTALAIGSAIALAYVGAASAAVIGIEEGPRGDGRAIGLEAISFTGHGACGAGGSVVGDGCSVVIKTDPNAPDAYGRLSIMGRSWADSQDLAWVTIEYTSELAFSSLTGVFTDLRDQPNSFARVIAGTAMWKAAERQANGAVNELTVLFDGPTKHARIDVFTRWNDGWGFELARADAPIITPPPSSVPLPAAGVLLAGAIGALGIARRRRA